MVHPNQVMGASLMKDLLVEVWAGTGRISDGKDDHPKASKAEGREHSLQPGETRSHRRGGIQ